MRLHHVNWAVSLKGKVCNSDANINKRNDTWTRRAVGEETEEDNIDDQTWT